MIQIDNKQDCCGCNVCGDVCPCGAISFETDNEGFWYPQVDSLKCIECKKCELVCPIINCNRIVKDNFTNPKCYVAEHKSIDVVFSSTSGGVFSALAETMYAYDGYVVGAIHNDDFSVSELVSNDRNDLGRLRRSKDLQSDSAGVYLKIKSLLEKSENVLMCGLPCQIAALKSYLGKDYANLITVELVCLGVNSPKVWRKYLDYIEEINKSKIISTENKSKEYGWHLLTQKFVFENDEEYFDTVETSLFIKGFIRSHLYCRPSCYDCNFKGFPRIADITIGDFWGIEKRDPSYNSNMGTSLVLINTDKGTYYFEKVQKRLKIKEVPLEWAIQGNPALTKSLSVISKKRKEFFDCLNDCSFDKAIEIYGELPKPTFKMKVKSQLSLIKRIVTVTRCHPIAIFRTIRYSGIRNLLHHKGIICGSHSIINIDRKANIEFNGLLVLGSKGHFPRSKAESRLFVGQNATLRVLGDFEIEYDCDIEVFKGAELVIHGKKLRKSDANEGLTIICGEKIEIGCDVGIGRDVLIRDTNGNHYINTLGYRTSRPVIIGDKAWLCESCTIMPGVKLGRGVIVGVNSTVTKSMPAHTLVSGSPARIVQEEVLWRF